MIEPMELFVTGERITIPFSVPLPIQRGSVEAYLSTTKAGPPVHPTLCRTLSVEGGKAEAFTLFARDVRALWPRGGPCWIVVRYAGTVVATGQIRLVL